MPPLLRVDDENECSEKDIFEAESRRIFHPGGRTKSGVVFWSKKLTNFVFTERMREKKLQQVVERGERVVNSNFSNEKKSSQRGPRVMQVFPKAPSSL